MYDNEYINFISQKISYNDLLKVSNVMNVNVPGFPSNKLRSVPEKMLRNHFRKRLQRYGSATDFYKRKIELYERSYTGLNEREFLYKLKNDHEIDDLTKLILITYYFPNLYYENKEKILKLKSCADVMEIFIGEIDYKEDWEAKIKILSKAVAQNIFYLFSDLDKKVLEELTGGLFNIAFLKILKYLDEKKYGSIPIDQANVLKDKIFIMVIFEFLERWRKEKTNYEKDLLSLKTLKEDTVVNNQSLQKKLKKLKHEKEILSDNIHSLEEEEKKLINKYECLVEEKNDVIKTVRKEKQKLEQNYNNQVLLLKSQLQGYKQKVQESYEKKHGYNLISENIILFQSENNELTEMLLGKERIFLFQTMDELEEKIASQVNSGQLIFIATDGLSSRDIFRIEKWLNEKPDIHFRFVSQGSKSIIRKIISYLEGELRYAAIK